MANKWQTGELDVFTKEVVQLLAENKITAIAVHWQAGVKVDMLIEYKNSLFGIDLLGTFGLRLLF